MLARRLAFPLMLATLLSAFAGSPEQEGGREQEAHPDPDPNILSALIIVPPLLNCGESVTVKGFVSNARIKIYVDGDPTPRAEEDGRDPEGQTFRLQEALRTGQSVTATQEYEGFPGPRSPAEVVLDHGAAYPDGLPPPGMPFQPLFECGIATFADNLPPGGKVRVFDQAEMAAPPSLIGGVAGVAAGQTIAVDPAFIAEHQVTVQSEICGMPSGLAGPFTVTRATLPLPTPQSTGIYENGQILTVTQLVNGARVTISRGGEVIGGGGAPGNDVRFWLSSPVAAGEPIEIVQELCAARSMPGTADVHPCESLPAPRISAPWAGDETIRVIDPVPGSRIRVYVDAHEIADGGGKEIRLTRPLGATDELIVTQSLGTCDAHMAWAVRVGRGLDDPTVPGPNQPAQFEYGHPGDSQRRTTDVTRYFLTPDMRVLDAGIRMTAVPLHGVVRYPSGTGPYPLVLIVHGNHSPTDPSYPGYDYLLDLLASHSMIAVSIDEDFLNGDVMGGDMDARGIVLLRHLQLWREWNQTPGHPFFGKVDMDKIGLSGHSRGGEAIVAAHLLNGRDHDPAVDAQNFGFNIRSLYAIAPVDGQFFEDHRNGQGIILRGGADYYVMHGSHDGDIYTFEGQRMYNRTYPEDSATSNTKGLLFVYGANHGQWNSRWETCCEQTFEAVDSRIASHDQKQIGKAYMNAFFRMSLKGEQAYKHFLNGDATFATLPSAITRVFQYQDPHRLFIDHYEEDGNSLSASLPRANNSFFGTFARHVEENLTGQGPSHFLWGASRGLIVGWEGSANPEYRIDLPVGALSAIPAYRFLAFQTGQTHEQPRWLNDPGANQDFSVQLRFGTTPGPEVNVSSYAPLRYPMVTGPYNHRYDGLVPNTKSIQQTVRIPFANLRPDPGLSLRDVTQIILKFNQRVSGNIVIDEIQFTD